MKGIFSIHGIPQTLVSDNMPFHSLECKTFAQAWSFNITTISPKYPRSNGQVERAVQTAKQMLKKCKEDSKDLEVALLEYRNMPIAGLNISPLQILFSRRVRTKIPVHTNLLKPIVPHNAHDKIVEKQRGTKAYHDLTAKPREGFETGENVLVKTEKVWEPAKVVTQHKSPRCYLILNNKGNVLRRNSSHLKKTHTELHTDSEPDLAKANVPNYNNKEKPNVNPSLNKNITRSGRVIKTPAHLKDFQT